MRAGETRNSLNACFICVHIHYGLSFCARGVEPTGPLAFSTVLGLNALSGMDTGTTGGRQSTTLAPAMSVGSWIVSIGSSPTASDITCTGWKGRCDRLVDLGVAPRTVSSGDAGSSFELGGIGKRARSRVI